MHWNEIYLLNCRNVLLAFVKGEKTRKLDTWSPGMTVLDHYIETLALSGQCHQSMASSGYAFVDMLIPEILEAPVSLSKRTYGFLLFLAKQYYIKGKIAGYSYRRPLQPIFFLCRPRLLQLLNGSFFLTEWLMLEASGRKEGSGFTALRMWRQSCFLWHSVNMIKFW